MKKYFAILFVLTILFSSSSCTTTIPNSAEAKEKMEAHGYETKIEVLYGEAVSALGIQQITFLFCDKEDDFLQVYFFANKEDTDKYYKDYQSSLESDVEVIRKNRYSIYRGTKAAADDFLS